MNLERIEAENITGSDQLDALIYLAEYAKVNANMLSVLCNKCLSVQLEQNKNVFAVLINCNEVY